MPFPLGDVKRIRLLWTGRLGDILIATPFMAGLRTRFPKARITLVTGERGAAAAALCADIDDFLILRPFHGLLDNLRLAYELAAKPDDLLIELNTAFSRSSTALAALARSRAKVAFARGRGDSLFTHLLPAASENEHMLDRYARLAEALGAPYEPKLRVRVLSSDRDAAEASIARLKLPPGRRLILVHPGNFKKIDNRWPADKFVELTEHILSRPDVSVLYLAGPGEEAAVRGLVSRLSKPLPILGPLPLGRCAATLARMDLVVANATGTAHLAVAVGATTFCLLGRYTQTVWMPRPGTPGFFSVVSNSWESCQGITVEAAVTALDRALNSLPPRA